MKLPLFVITLSFLAFWLGTGVVWFVVDWSIKPLRLRVWRSLTWLPYVLADLVRGKR